MVSIRRGDEVQPDDMTSAPAVTLDGHRDSAPLQELAANIPYGFARKFGVVLLDQEPEDPRFKVALRSPAIFRQPRTCSTAQTMRPRSG